MERRAKQLQILEHSACLKPDQLTGYLDGTLFKEELRVVELHLASCQFCREALDGMEDIDHRKALIEELSLPALPVRKVVSNPAVSVQKDINSPKELKAIQPLPKSTFNPYPKHPISHSRNLSWLGITGIAVLLLLGGVLFWQYQRSLPEWTSFVFDTGSSSKNLFIDSSRQEVPPDTSTSGHVQTHPPTLVRESNQSHNEESAVPVEESAATSQLQEQYSKQPSSAIAAARMRAPVSATETTSKQEEKPLTSTQSIAFSPGKTAQPKEQSVKEVPAKAPSANAQKEDAVADARPSDYTIGLGLYQKKQYASALLYLEAVAGDSRHPNHWDAVYYSALCNLEIGKSGKAKRLLKSIVKADAPLSEKAEEQLERM